MFIDILVGTLIINSDVTYTKNVKPIFAQRCANCHGPSWVDKNWMDYDTAKKNAEKIKERVSIKKDMPPGNLTEITDKERETIKQWVDGGAKK